MKDDDKVNAVVGGNLRRLRLERGMTRLALAEKAGIDDSHLGKMERGKRGTSSGGYQRLADALGIAVADLFAVQPTPSPKKRGARPRRLRPAPRAAPGRLVRVVHEGSFPQPKP
jgi:transcriptional regulator with XRE-family HTH domain